MAVENGGSAGVDLAAGEEPAAKKNKKQVILNPDGEDTAIERFNHEDLVIDKAQAAKLESYSCYAGVPRRDKAGDIMLLASKSIFDDKATLSDFKSPPLPPTKFTSLFEERKHHW